jgi:hypothetical protein
VEVPCILRGLGFQCVSIQELGPMEIHRSPRSKLLGVEIYKVVKGKKNKIYLLVIGCKSIV